MVNLPAAPAPDPGWTCPFCALLCDDLAPAGACGRAQAAITGLAAAPSTALIDGQPATPEQALDEAARRLHGWRQPLFGGMGTDIAGARALYRLAARTGAIADAADSDAFFGALRALQDRGQYTVTLADLRRHARLLVCVGTDASAYPEFWRRAGLGQPGSACQRVVFLGAAPAPLPAGVEGQALPGSGDLLADLQALALALQRPGRGGPMQALAQDALASPYSVWLMEPARLPAAAPALAVEGVQRIVALLNARTRAAGFVLGGNDGAASANQAFTWLSGLPLRTRVAATGLQHEPHRHATTRVLADGAVDGLLWVMSFRADRLPPPAPLPRIVLGPPAMGAALGGQGVFIPVATPGWNAAGHLFRTDGPIVLPLVATREAGLPGVAQVADALRLRLEAAA